MMRTLRRMMCFFINHKPMYIIEEMELENMTVGHGWMGAVKRATVKCMRCGDKIGGWPV